MLSKNQAERQSRRLPIQRLHLLTLMILGVGIVSTVAQVADENESQSALEPEVATGLSALQRETEFAATTRFEFPVRLNNIYDTPSGQAFFESAQQLNKLYYGTDDRYDIFALPVNSDYRTWSKSVCLLTFVTSLRHTEDGSHKLRSNPYTVEGLPPCEGEAFGDQPVGGFCTGFLVGPDLIATAGHCIQSAEDIESIAFVFGFSMADSRTARTTFDSNEVYSGKAVIARELSDDIDYAIIKLDRVVSAPGASPLSIRADQPTVGTSIGVIGHPAGLPLKVAFGEKTIVRRVADGAFFEGNLDTYGGNSGSPVFNLDGEVIGILVRGQRDYIVSREKGCFISNSLADNEGGESVTKASVFVETIPKS